MPPTFRRAQPAVSRRDSRYGTMQSQTSIVRCLKMYYWKPRGHTTTNGKVGVTSGGWRQYQHLALVGCHSVAASRHGRSERWPELCERLMLHFEVPVVVDCDCGGVVAYQSLAHARGRFHSESLLAASDAGRAVLLLAAVHELPALRVAGASYDRVPSGQLGTYKCGLNIKASTFGPNHKICATASEHQGSLPISLQLGEDITEQKTKNKNKCCGTWMPLENLMLLLLSFLLE